MALFQVTENDRRIYEQQLRDFLPDRLIDIHTHIWLERLRPPLAKKGDAAKRTVSWPSLVAKENSVEDLEETYRLLFPGKHVTPLIFTSTRRDTAGALNEYVRESAARTGYPALYYARPEQSAEELERMIRSGRFLGIKSYLSFAPDYIPAGEIRIFDFFPKHQLEKMNDLGAIVMLHIPRDGRLKDPVNLAQILEIKRCFPRVLLIVAHIGRAYTNEDIGDAFEVLSEAEDLLFDFSANCCESAMEAMLKSVGPNRALFGSDLPILRMRTRRIEEGGTYINLVPPGLYGSPLEDRHLREVSREEGEALTFFLYEEILAFKRVAVRMNLSRTDISNVFYGNAAALIAAARENIYGE